MPRLPRAIRIKLPREVDPRCDLLDPEELQDRQYLSVDEVEES